MNIVTLLENNYMNCKLNNIICVKVLKCSLDVYKRK